MRRNIDAFSIKSGPTESGVISGPPLLPTLTGVFWMPFFVSVIVLGLTSVCLPLLMFLINKLFK